MLDQVGNIINAAVALFCSVGVTGLYGTADADVTPAYALFCLSYAALFVLSLTRICYVQMSGERLSGAYAEIRWGSYNYILWATTWSSAVNIIDGDGGPKF